MLRCHTVQAMPSGNKPGLSGSTGIIPNNRFFSRLLGVYWELFIDWNHVDS